jgi:serine kinase of HPr protein (carbohydrate metabolism regulator)
MPVAPGRNVAILVEVAARNQLLRARGHHAARKFAARLERQLCEPQQDEQAEPFAREGEADRREKP